MWARSKFSKLVATLCVVAVSLAGLGSFSLSQASLGQDGVQPGAEAPPPPMPGDTSLAAPALPSASGEAPEGVEVLTRGPVHEAFATPTELDPQPGPVVPKEPPAAIEEVPPDEKPEGKNVVWIPGYYAWDDDRDDFIWISGLWRNAPPSQQWVPGYWTKSDNGSQWTPGFWASAERGEVEYLEEAPPQTIEAGPNGPAPSEDHFWIPGSWVNREARYVWRPGYWAVAQPNWIWTPARYVWCPSGYVFVDGYWDYAIAQRGCLFAPVYFQPVVYARPAFVYTPSVVINAGFFTSHLFYRPSYCSYYFGDYYAVRYGGLGFRPWFSVGFGWSRGHDHIYSYYRWRNHRHNPHWANNLHRDFDRRRHNEFDRPPHTYAAQRKLLSDPRYAKRDDFRLASNIKDVSRNRDSSATALKLRTIDSKDRLQAVERSKDFKKVANQRLDIEKRPVAMKRDSDGRRDSDVRRDGDAKRDIARSGQDRERAPAEGLANKLKEGAKNTERRTLKLPAAKDQGANVARSGQAPRKLEQLERDRKVVQPDRKPDVANRNSARPTFQKPNVENQRDSGKSPFVDSDSGRNTTAEQLRRQRANDSKGSAIQKQLNDSKSAGTAGTTGRTNNAPPVRNNTSQPTRRLTQPNAQSPKTPAVTERRGTTSPQGRTSTQPDATTRSKLEAGRSMSNGRSQTAPPRVLTPRTNANPGGGGSSIRQFTPSPSGNRDAGARSSGQTRQMLDAIRSGSGSRNASPSGASPRSFSPKSGSGGQGPAGRSGSSRSGRGRSADAGSPRSDMAIDSPGAVAGISPVINSPLVAANAPASAQVRPGQDIEDPDTVRKEQREVSDLFRLRDDVNKILGRDTPAQTERRSSFSLLKPEEQNTLDFKPPHPDARNVASGPPGGGSPTTEMGRPLDASMPGLNPFKDGSARADRATVMSQTDPRGSTRPKADYDYRSMVKRGQTLSGAAAGTYAKVVVPEEGESSNPLLRRSLTGASSYTSTPNRTPFYSGPNSPSMSDASAASSLMTGSTPRPTASTTLPTGAGSLLPPESRARWQSIAPTTSAARPSVRAGQSYDPTKASTNRSFNPTRSSGGSYDPTRGRAAPRNYYQTQ